MRDGLTEEAERSPVPRDHAVVRNAVPAAQYSGTNPCHVDLRITGRDELEVRAEAVALRLAEERHLARVRHHGLEGERDALLYEVTAHNLRDR